MFSYARWAGTPAREAEQAQIDLLAFEDEVSVSGESTKTAAVQSKLQAVQRADALTVGTSSSATALSTGIKKSIDIWITSYL